MEDMVQTSKIRFTEMSKVAMGIMIMGSPGAGKTTLGKMVAKELGYTFVDIDEYIWRKDTEVPFLVMYTVS